MADDEIKRKINEIARKLLDKIAAELFTGSFTEASTTAADPFPHADPLEQLRQTMDKIMSQPVLVAVWFIDKRLEYHQIERMAFKAGHSVNGRQYKDGEYIAAPLFSVRLHNWTVKEIDERCRELTEVDGLTAGQVARVFPFRRAGVWLEWSNGKHQQLLLAKNKLEAALLEMIAGSAGVN